MRVRSLCVAAALASATLVSVPQVAPANHCGNYPLAPPTQQLSPVLVIASGYFGVGGLGAFDGYGCVAGQQAADTRVLLPKADFVVLVLARVSCSTGQSISTGSLSGLGLNVSNIPMSCSRDLYATLGLPNHTSYVSDLYPVSGTGTITGGAVLGSATYNAQSQKIV